jgi:hypothetical protein
MKWRFWSLCGETSKSPSGFALLSFGMLYDQTVCTYEIKISLKEINAKWNNLHHTHWTEMDIKCSGSALKRGAGGRGREGEKQWGEMVQIMYTHKNKWINN